MAHDLDLAAISLRDADLVAEVTRSAFDLDLVVEEFFEGAEVEDLVADGLRAVDCVLREARQCCT